MSTKDNTRLLIFSILEIFLCNQIAGIFATVFYVAAMYALRENRGDAYYRYIRYCRIALIIGLIIGIIFGIIYAIAGIFTLLLST